MTFQPILPYRGSDGWGYLKETLDSQKTKYDDAVPSLTKVDLQRFANVIPTTTSINAFMEDGTLINVALEAFGLGERRPSAAYLREVLTTSTVEPGAEKKFDDPRWFEMAKTFGYGDGTPKVADPGFADDVLARHRIQGFEKAVGAASPEMRRALAFDRTMTSLAGVGYEEQAGWQQVVADDNARTVFARALGMGPGFDAASSAEQARQLRVAAEAVTGSRTIDAFSTEAIRDTVLDRFFAAEQGGSLAGLGFTQPRIGQGGTSGWSLLQNSLETQRAGFERIAARDPSLRYFASEIGGIESAEDFVADERLVDVALTAFGLGRMRPTADFVQQVLESDADDPASFAARQDDPRWAEMARVFGFGDGGGARVADFGFAEDIAARWAIAGFEEAVGAQDNDLRMGLILDRTLEALSGAGLDADEAWGRALANPAIAQVMGHAIGRGDDFATLPQSRQIELAKAEARRLTGSEGVEGFSRDVARDALVRNFLRESAGDDRAGGNPTPVLPLQGIAGWRFLKRTLPDQQESFANSVQVRREMDYFRENIGAVETAADLVNDRRLLAVALEAFGMSEEIDKRAFVQKALEEGTENPQALAARMVDPRYRAFADAFGFGNGAGAQTRVDGFAEGILAQFKVRAFESAVGAQDDTMRLALNFDRAAVEYATQGVSEDAAWFRVLGDVPMREVIEGALSLPREFAQIDIEQQVAVVRERMQRRFGSDSILAFTDPANREDMISGFIVRSQVDQFSGGFGASSTALTLLQSSAQPSGLNLLL